MAENKPQPQAVEDEFQRANHPETLTTHFNIFEGMRNTVPRSDLKQTDVWQATNIDFNRDGRPFLRPGYTKVASGNWTTVWSNGTFRFGVQNGNLVEINPDDSVSIVVPAVGSSPMSFAFYKDTVYYTNNQVIGYIKNHTGYYLTAPTKRYKALPPAGQSIAYFMGSLYICRSNQVWVTDPFKFNQVDLRYGIFSFPETITMFAPIEGKPSPYMRSLHSHGIWIATATHLYYLSGQTPIKYIIRDVYAVGNPTGAFAYVDATLFKGNTEVGQIVVFPTTAGVYWGTNGGQYGNLTSVKYVMPTGVQGGAVFRTGNINQVIIALH